MSFTEPNVNGVIFDTAGTLSVGGVRHAFTTRHGGVSPAPFDSLNLASNRGDREENILENYRRLGAAVGFDASRAVGCRQIHSDLVRVAREEDAGKMVHLGGGEGRIAGATQSLVDYNRAGTPLTELVTEPDLRPPEEARLFMQKLRQIYAYYAGDAEMAEKASIYGALTLYLDFINIFLYVVRLMGNNRRRS